MGRVKIFTKKNCPRCPQARAIGEILRGRGVQVEYFDLDTADGLAEAAFYNIQATPAILVEDTEERVIAIWAGNVPQLKEVEGLISGVWR